MKTFYIYKSYLQKNGQVSSSNLHTIELIENDVIVDSFIPVILTDGGYATKKTFKMDFSNYKYESVRNGKVLVFNDATYFDLKSKYCKEYKTWVDKEGNNTALKNLAWASHMNDPYDIG